MHAEVRDAIARLVPEGARTLVLRGAGRAFCAGQDLNDRAVAPGSKPVDLGESIEKHYRPLMLSLRSLPLPVIAAVNGVAAGAGANIALACDIVIAARSASFIQSFSKLGLVPDCGGTWTLPHLAGNARALGLALLGDRLSAEQAANWGLIWRCVDDAEFDAAVDASRRRNSPPDPPAAWRARKQAMHAAWGLSFEAALDNEAGMQRELGASSDYAEGVAAFGAKRAPRFTGN